MRTILISLLTLVLACGCTLFVDFEPQNKKETNCRDGLDNDNDGAADCYDPDCWFATNCTGELCDNGFDDDGDGFWDCEDPECFDHESCGNAGEICDNGFDDDGDAMVDCDDPECYFHPHCTVTWEDCTNLFDDDGDGDIDCEDMDCWEHIACMARELCTNNIDDDGDGYIDCDDEDCYGIDGCDLPGGEFDCGNNYDDDGDGRRDCGDPDCQDSILCQTPLLSPCTANVTHTYNLGQVIYYRDIYQNGETQDCGNGRRCAIRPDVSMIPHCYPQATGVAAAYQPCAGQICGPGLVCLSPEPMAQELCLPLCAPGINTECVGGNGLCLRYWMTNFDYHVNKNIELWTCGRPECDPMNITENGCNPITYACYPSTDLFGEATCVNQAGTTAQLMPCPNGDHQCIPGHVCRQGDNDTTSVCRKLCKILSDCPTTPGAACKRDDSRQLFGYCI